MTNTLSVEILFFNKNFSKLGATKSDNGFEKTCTSINEIKVTNFCW